MMPRPYLSFSAMSTWEMSPEKYIREYIYGEKPPQTINMQYGSLLADSLEAEELSGDLLLDLVMTRLPKYDLADESSFCSPWAGFVAGLPVPVLMFGSSFSGDLTVS